MGFDKEIVKNNHRDFSQFSLSDEVPNSPFVLFEKWFEQAQKDNIKDFNAMALSTLSKKNEVSSRIVYLKDIIDNEFVFFSNYASQKATDIDCNPNVSILFFWKELERQIRIKGMVTKTSEEISNEYFQSRPYESKIGAMASNQSQKIDSREVLEKEYKFTLKNNPINQKILKPKDWGGYKIKPHYFEFWQGRKYRLHDRISYERHDLLWKKFRLNP